MFLLFVVVVNTISVKFSIRESVGTEGTDWRDTQASMFTGGERDIALHRKAMIFSLRESDMRYPLWGYLVESSLSARAFTKGARR